MIDKSSIPYPLVKIAHKILGRGRLFANSYPLKSGRETLSPFFIVGCGRSGNTLLRAMLVAGNDLLIPPESYVIPRVVRLFLTFAYLPWEQLSSIIISEFESFEEFYTWELDLGVVHTKARKLVKKERTLSNIIDLIYKEYAAKLGLKNIRWGDKTPTNSFFIEHIHDIYPKAQYIHMIRDPRAVYYSYKGFNQTRNRGSEQPSTVVNRWLKSNKRIEACKTKMDDSQFLTLHYENLVRNPESELNRVSNFLGVEYKPEMLSYWQSISLGDVNYHQHHNNVLKPLDADKTNNWETALSKDEILFVERYCSAFYTHLCDKYKLT